MVVNEALAKKKGLSEQTINKINSLHDECDKLIVIMDETEVNSLEFQTSLYQWRQHQTELQKLWGFKVDSSKWMEYKIIPKCKCPQMDNDDAGCHYYVNGNCPVHAKEVKKNVKKN